jgi:hypothetical protein
VQESEFELQTLHLFTFKVEFQATRLPKKKKSSYTSFIAKYMHTSTMKIMSIKKNYWNNKFV